MTGLDEEGRRRSAVDRQKREKDEERARDAKYIAAIAAILKERAKKHAETEAEAWQSPEKFRSNPPAILL